MVRGVTRENGFHVRFAPLRPQGAECATPPVGGETRRERREEGGGERVHEAKRPDRVNEGGKR